MPRTRIHQEPAEPSTRVKATKSLDALAKIASRFEGFRPATEVLTEVRAVETIFPQLNRATGVNGWPVQRISLIHGPSANGKTLVLRVLNMVFILYG